MRIVQEPVYVLCSFHDWGRARLRDINGIEGVCGGSDMAEGELLPNSRRFRLASRSRSCTLHCSGVNSFVEPISLIW